MIASSDQRTERAPASSLRSVFSRSGLAWVFGLCSPLLALSLHFKLLRIAQRRIEPSPLELAVLLCSDLATVSAWVAVGIGLIVWAERPAMRLAARVTLQLLGVFYACVLLGAHGYFMSTGSSLDYPMLAFSLSHLDETAKVIGSAKSPGRMFAFVSTVVAVLVLPWLLARLAGKERGETRASDRCLGLLYAWSYAGLALTVAIGARSEQGLDLTRDPLLNIALTFGASRDDEDIALIERARRRPTGAKAIAKTERTTNKNVVIILLESTGAWATSMYDGEYETTPFLAELAQKSLVAQRMHAVEPHTSKALTATLCGIEPRPGVSVAEAVPGGIPGTCLADLLETQGYHTAYFQVATQDFENRPQLVRNMGYDEFHSGDRMSHAGLVRANYFGYEDRILLPPLKRWLEGRAKKKEQPFFLTVLTNGPHHEYLMTPHYGVSEFSHETMTNRYLNAVRYDDFVLRDLLKEFERTGLAANTVFIILGDHGEGFGQHGRYAHDDTIYQNGLHIPFLIYEPSNPTRREIRGLHNELDVPPTVLDMLGLKVVAGKYIGASLLGPEDPKRVLYAACYNDNKCLARFEGNLKLVHHFDRQRDQLFDLSRDPLEEQNLAAKHKDEVRRMRDDVLDWYRVTRAMYRPVTDRASSPFVTSVRPEVQHAKRVTFGSVVAYLGYSSDVSKLRPGASFIVTYHFQVLERIPPGFRLFVHGWDGKRRHTWDHVPVSRLYPEDYWRPGQYISDRHLIHMPRQWNSDRLVIRGGFWKPKGPRLATKPPTENGDPVLVEIPVEH